MIEEPSHIQPRRIAMVFIAIIVGFLMAEVPYNPDLLSMEIRFVAYGLFINGIICGIFYTFGMHTRGSICAYLAASFCWGTAQYFVSTFKGLPFQPSDLFALGTAAEVAGGFSYVPNAQIIICFIALVLCCVIIFKFVPKKPVTKLGILVNIILGIALLSGCYFFVDNYDLRKEADAKVDVWFVLNSYKKQGSELCFAILAQQLSVDEPEGYSDTTAEGLVYDSSSGSEPKQTGNAKEVQPTVIAIMDETFSDLSKYPGMEYAADCVENFREIQSNSVISGDLYVSALGGGTCNSEFEFLTSLSMGNIEGGSYPYVLYSFKGVKSVVSYFNDEGYGTHAMHPAGGNNWNRNRIYSQLGFETFDDIESFEGAPMLRNKTTDKATFDKIIEILDEQKEENPEQPQFVFDVTYQNHSGYTSGLVPKKLYYEATVNGEPNTEVSEYLSVIRQADKMLAKFVKQLEKRDEPIVLIYFGDHQPGFATDLYKQTFGVDTGDLETIDTQFRYTVPYFIWTNYDTGVDQIEMNLSTNYLVAEALTTLGFNENPYYDFIMETKKSIPAMNLNGYQTNDGQWHWFDEETEASEALKKYRIVQFGNMFGKKNVLPSEK